MSLDKLKLVSDQILSRLPSVKGKGEEATKQALVLPMLDALGYDIWNPGEVCPEFEADFAIKKAGQKEKVDLAISINGVPKIYFETKSVDTSLDGHEGQLARYFNSTKTVTLGILTNGIEWRFFTDTGDPNVMDSQPFHVVRLESIDQGLDVMARFAKPVFSAEAIREFATELKYTASIATFLRGELDLKDRDPSEYFIRWVLKADSMYDGIVNANVVERFRPIAKSALTRVVREIVRRSVAAMDQQAAEPSNPQAESPAQDHGQDALDHENPSDSSRQIQTTERELRSFQIVKDFFEASDLASRQIFDATLRKDTPIELAYKDTTGYFGIYLNKPSWWILRIVSEAKRPWVGFALSKEQLASHLPSDFQILESSAFAESRVAITDMEDLNRLKPAILAAIQQVILDRKPGSGST